MAAAAMDGDDALKRRRRRALYLRAVTFAALRALILFLLLRWTSHRIVRLLAGRSSDKEGRLGGGEDERVPVGGVGSDGAGDRSLDGDATAAKNETIEKQEERPPPKNETKKTKTKKNIVQRVEIREVIERIPIHVKRTSVTQDQLAQVKAAVDAMPLDPSSAPSYVPPGADEEDEEEEEETNDEYAHEEEETRRVLESMRIAAADAEASLSTTDDALQSLTSALEKLDLPSLLHGGSGSGGDEEENRRASTAEGTLVHKITSQLMPALNLNTFAHLSTEELTSILGMARDAASHLAVLNKVGKINADGLDALGDTLSPYFRRDDYSLEAEGETATTGTAMTTMMLKCDPSFLVGPEQVLDVHGAAAAAVTDDEGSTMEDNDENEEDEENPDTATEGDLYRLVAEVREAIRRMQKPPSSTSSSTSHDPNAKPLSLLEADERTDDYARLVSQISNGVASAHAGLKERHSHMRTLRLQKEARLQRIRAQRLGYRGRSKVCIDEAFVTRLVEVGLDSLMRQPNTRRELLARTLSDAANEWIDASLAAAAGDDDEEEGGGGGGGTDLSEREWRIQLDPIAPPYNPDDDDIYDDNGSGGGAGDASTWTTTTSSSSSSTSPPHPPRGWKYGNTLRSVVDTPLLRKGMDAVDDVAEMVGGYNDYVDRVLDAWAAEAGGGEGGNDGDGNGGGGSVGKAMGNALLDVLGDVPVPAEGVLRDQRESAGILAGGFGRRKSRRDA